LTNFYRPAFLTPDLFEDDGQMRGEVFNYASFQQSKMFAKGVVCSDCHDPHAGKLKAEGSEVCSQCHLPQKFSTVAHSGHQPGRGAPDCVSCHMPAKTYMVVDVRHDHSFRIPRPDLTTALGVSNTCSACHPAKPPEWAAAAIERWHGPQRKGFQTYAAAFHAARTEQPEARDLLLAVLRDAPTPAIARATALVSLQGSPSVEVDAAMDKGLSDPDPMVRIAALGGVSRLPAEQRWRRAGPLLGDPIRAVRMAAATTLAEGPPADATPEMRQAFEKAAAEYVDGERFNADRAESRSNLAHFLIREGKPGDAENQYLEAITLTPSVAPRVDLADLYRMLGREADVERVLREAIASDAQAAAPQHALGLSLIRQKRYGEALDALKRAVDLAPGQPRYAYVYAVALQSTGYQADAKAALERALMLSPSDVQILAALLEATLQAGELRQALPYAERLVILLPDDPSIGSLVEQIKRATETDLPK
jgi:predicted CXXCH cytochrome family protein